LIGYQVCNWEPLGRLDIAAALLHIRFDGHMVTCYERTPMTGLKKLAIYEVKGVKSQGRTKRIWKEEVKGDMKHFTIKKMLWFTETWSRLEN